MTDPERQQPPESPTSSEAVKLRKLRADIEHGEEGRQSLAADVMRRLGKAAEKLQPGDVVVISEDKQGKTLLVPARYDEKKKELVSLFPGVTVPPSDLGYTIRASDLPVSLSTALPQVQEFLREQQEKNALDEKIYRAEGTLAQQETGPITLESLKFRFFATMRRNAEARDLRTLLKAFQTLKGKLKSGDLIRVKGDVFVRIYSEGGKTKLDPPDGPQEGGGLFLVSARDLTPEAEERLQKQIDTLLGKKK